MNKVGRLEANEDRCRSACPAGPAHEIESEPIRSARGLKPPVATQVVNSRREIRRVGKDCHLQLDVTGQMFAAKIVRGCRWFMRKCQPFRTLISFGYERVHFAQNMPIPCGSQFACRERQQTLSINSRVWGVQTVIAGLLLKRPAERGETIIYVGRILPAPRFCVPMPHGEHFWTGASGQHRWHILLGLQQPKMEDVPVETEEAQLCSPIMPVGIE